MMTTFFHRPRKLDVEWKKLQFVAAAKTGNQPGGLLHHHHIVANFPGFPEA